METFVALNVLPELKPNQPNQRMKAPTDASGKLEGGTMLADPSSLNLPICRPMNKAAASAENPPKAWITAEPAKSIIPSLPNQPPTAHIQCPANGYMIPVIAIV